MITTLQMRESNPPKATGVVGEEAWSLIPAAVSPLGTCSSPTIRVHACACTSIWSACLEF